jgi:HAD superfamily hydrolase (TIGR01509 family)
MADAARRGAARRCSDLVIFDCDGVLVDSEPIAAAVLGEALRGEGLAMTDQEVHHTFRGLTFERTIEIVEERLGRPLFSDFAERVQARTFEAFRRGLSAMPGVNEALDRLEVPYCVASSGEPEKMRLTLGLTGLLGRFDGRMFSASEVAQGKPAPDLFLHAARCMGAAPHRTIVVEDSIAGVTAARAASMRVYGYAAAGDGAALEAAGATLLGDLRDLPRWIEEGT